MQSNYIPWRGYFDLISKVDEFIIYDCVQYTKNDWRNRNLIKTPNGKQWLTIPVYHKLNQKIDEIIVADNSWNINHWQTIEQFYNKAKYFDEYKDIFYDTYLHMSTVYLSLINLCFIEIICEIFKIDTPIINSSELEIKGSRSERLVNICKQRGAKKYLSGPAAKNYLDVDLMNSEGISVEWMTYDYPEYKQLHPPFDQKVTILDMIFNCGIYA